MTLTAAIGTDTKVAYVEEDNVIKVTWEQYDKVSLISLDNGGFVLSNDIFKAVSAGNVADFEGTFTNDPSTAQVLVVYPALTEGEGTDSKPWQVPVDNTGASEGVLYNVKVGSSYLNYRSSYFLQKAPNDYTHLQQYTVMSGMADLDDIENNKLNVTLSHRSYIVKAEITLPKSGLKVKDMTVDVKLEDGSRGIVVGGSGWTDAKEPEYFPGGWNTYYELFFGESYGDGFVVPETVFTAYFVAFAGASWDYYAQETKRYSLKAGDYFEFSLKAFDGEAEYNCILDKKVVTKDLEFENGKVYRLSATLVKE